MTAFSSQNPLTSLRGSLSAAALTAGMLASFVGPALADPMSSIHLIAHRAIYELELSKASDKSGIAKASGRLVFEIEGDNCVGYSVNMRIVTQFATATGTVNTIDTRSTAWEAPEGDIMRFGNKQYVNAALSDDVEGKAQRGGTANFLKPEGSFELPNNTVFPVEHTKRIVTAAREGNVMDRTVIFDGTELNKLYTAVSFIGKAKKVDDIKLPEAVTDRSAFEGQTAWPITVSYFDQASADTSGEQIPSHEVSFTMFENGISTNLSLGYEHFTMTGTMSELTLFEPTECDH